MANVRGCFLNDDISMSFPLVFLLVKTSFRIAPLNNWAFQSWAHGMKQNQTCLGMSKPKICS